MQFYNSIDFEAKEKLLQDLIKKCIDEYALLTFAFNEEPYITEEMEQDMIHNVLERLWYRMSPAIKENLYFLYNAENDDKLLELLATQVALHVVDFKVSINSQKE